MLWTTLHPRTLSHTTYFTRKDRIHREVMQLFYNMLILAAVKRDRQVVYKHNIQACLHDYSDRAKAISITYSGGVCSLCYPACNAHAPRCHLWPVQFYNTFPHYLVNGLSFGGMFFNVICMFWFSLQLLCKTFLVLRRVEQDIVINVRRHLKYPL